MLSAAARSQLAVVLVGARNPSNIGAAARALQDFGFSDLRIVNSFAAPFEAAQLEGNALPKSAVAAASVMASAQRFDTLSAALADCHLVVGTTAVGERELRQPVLPLQDAAPRIVAPLNNTDQPTRVALLFGSEKTGLTRDQLSHCTLLTTIPMFAPAGARHLSMNLGQSVAVCLYELTRAGFEGAASVPAHHGEPAPAEDRERLLLLLREVLEVTGYTRRFPANTSDSILRPLVHQLGITPRETMTWMGILRQILWRSKSEANELT